MSVQKYIKWVFKKIKIGCKVIQVGGVCTVWPNTGT